MINRAMVLAAGLGKRMRPLTDTLPKPLVPVAGRALIDHVLDKLADAGVTQAMVNVHYQAGQIEAHLTRRPEREVVPFVYAGAAILNPAIFADAPNGAFSLNRLFDRAAEAGRLYGLRLEGTWMHVGTPEAIKAAEAAILESVA